MPVSEKPGFSPRGRGPDIKTFARRGSGKKNESQARSNRSVLKNRDNRKFSSGKRERRSSV